MSTNLTVNLLRVLFVTFCAAVGSSVTAEAADNPLQGLLVGIVFGLALVLIDRLLKGFSLRAFSSATLGLLLGLFFANLLISLGGAALPIGVHPMDRAARGLLRLWLSRHDARDAK